MVGGQYSEFCLGSARPCWLRSFLSRAGHHCVLQLLTGCLGVLLSSCCVIKCQQTCHTYTLLRLHGAIACLVVSSCQECLIIGCFCTCTCRNVKKRQDIGELMQYLNQVSETMTTFERRLWSHIRNYHDLAVNDPKLLVDCVRIIEIQV